MSKNFWHDIETGIDIPEIINVIVEIPNRGYWLGILKASKACNS